VVAQLWPRGRPDPAAVRRAAWVARCIGRGATVPLGRADVEALAAVLQSRRLEPGSVLFAAGAGPEGVWMIQSGQVELSVGSGRRRAVVEILHAGDVDGDIPLLLRMPPPYTARAVDPVECLYLTPEGFDRLLADHSQVARRWLTSVATRLAHSQTRLLGLLGGTLTQQTARLLLDEADAAGRVALPQRTLAAMLGAQRPSVNKVLGELANRQLVNLAYRTIRIIDRDGLAQVAR
jgi:CRP/FNR family transcriptional regulator, cAMP and macrophage regulator